MPMRWIGNRSTRLLVGLFVLPALAVRILVPQGFMPGTGADAAPTMQMCHGFGPLPAPTQPLPAGDDPAPGQGQEHHEASCVFAAAGSAAPPAPAVLALDARLIADLPSPTTDLFVAPKARYRAQAARAPPARSTRA